MATWQASFRFVAGAAGLPADYRARFATVLPLERSWSAEIEQWGAIDGDCIEVSDGPWLPDIRCRIDLREWRPALYERLVECLRGIGGELETDDGETVLLDLRSFEQALRASSAAEFVASPADFLERLRNAKAPGL